MSKSNKSTTPASSPGAPYSVGQNHPPKLSPVRPPEARAESPSYFGLVVESAHDPRESSGLARGNWSPASSSIKSFAAALPKHPTLESNPEFEAFKRQVDINRGQSFALPTSHYTQPTLNLPPVRPRPARWHTHASDNASDAFPRAFSAMRDRTAGRMDIDQDSLHDSAYVSSDSKRNSEASIPSWQVTSIPRLESPQPMDPNQPRTSLTRSEDRDPRLSMMAHRPEPLPGIHRAATMPINLEQPSMISATHLKDLMETVDEERLMLVDIRAASNFTLSRIKGALNLCLSTTLLKRPSCNIEKLKEMFQGGLGGEKLSAWRDMEWIIVYDSHSSNKPQAAAAQNTIMKFTNEGYTGNTGILRGGFSSFQSLCPELVDHAFAAATGGTGPSGPGRGGLAPVIGGVMLPTVNTCNPFFSNIRQNVELANGVGQQDVSWPNGLEPSILPQWLREAAAKLDHGKKVSDMFLRIELEEQSRMQNAYAAFTLGSACPSGKVQLSGVEKGGKNRYKDILPFEHARVRLQNKPEGSCDYINASHLTASRSNKRYIASQGPLPDTFEDFWTVVWEQDVRVIVMLTAESEGGQTKCHPYWEGREFGVIKLQPLSEKKASLDIDKYRSGSQSGSLSELSRRRAHTTTTVETTPNGQAMQGQTETPYVIIRKFALSHSDYPFAPIREITHLHFPTWPDFGTPAQPSHLLALVELANVIQRAALPVETASIVGSSRAASDALPFAWYDEPEADSASRPMLVHCSAGCGRTGTFCTVDSVIDMMKRQRLAKASAGHPHSQGADSDDAVSPLTNKEMNFKFKLDYDHPPSLPNGKSEEHIDTSWIHDDSVDLIQKTVEDFRGQRISMVQSLRQFVLCYETILEWISRVHDRGMTAPGGRRRSGSLHHA